MNGVLPHDRVVLFQFEALSSIFAVLLSNIAGGAGQTTGFVLGALKNDLNAVSFTFLSHTVEGMKCDILNQDKKDRALD